MSVPIDRTTYDGLHPSDRLALQFHAVLAAPDETKRQAQLARLDAWVAELGPRFDESEIQPLLAACQGTPLEPVRLGPDASGLAVRFVQIVFSAQVRGSRARIVSEDTLGISGGVCFGKTLKVRFVERRRGAGGSPGARGDWYFAPAALRDEAALSRALQAPLEVFVRPSAEHGFVLTASLLDRASLGWEAAKGGLLGAEPESELISLPELARDLEKHSTLGDGTVFGSLLTRLPDEKGEESGATLSWAATTPEAIVRFSALLAGGHGLSLDPGGRYPQRAVAKAVLALPGEEPVALDPRLLRSAPRLTQGLWAGLGEGLPALPWDSLLGPATEAD